MYAFIDENGEVLGLDVDHKEGFIEVDNNVMVGQVQQEDGSFLTPTPTQTPKEIRDEALANITWVRPADSVVVQIRHPDYASDYLMMKEAAEEMSDTDTENWIDIDDNPITMTKADFNAALAHNKSETRQIYATYIATL